MSKEAAATWLCFCSALITPLITRYVRRPPNLVLALLLWRARASLVWLPYSATSRNRCVFADHLEWSDNCEWILHADARFWFLWLVVLHLVKRITFLFVFVSSAYIEEARCMEWVPKSLFRKFSKIQQMPGMENGKIIYLTITTDYKCWKNPSFIIYIYSNMYFKLSCKILTSVGPRKLIENFKTPTIIHTVRIKIKNSAIKLKILNLTLS